MITVTFMVMTLFMSHEHSTVVIIPEKGQEACQFVGSAGHAADQRHQEHWDRARWEERIDPTP